MAARGAEGTRGQSRTSRELLSVGTRDSQSHLLITPKQCKKKGTGSPIIAVPRSSLLDRVQSFLPQMAQANETLQRQMSTAPANHFDIENVTDDLSNIIEMNVSLVELSDSDTSEAEEGTDSEDAGSESGDEWVTGEVTADNMRLPRPNGKKGKIEILESKNE